MLALTRQAPSGRRFASTRSCHEIQRGSEQDRRRRGWRVGLVAVLAITLVAHAAAIALDTGLAAAATVDERVVRAGQPRQRQAVANGNSSASGRHGKRAQLTQPEQRALLTRSRAPSRPIRGARGSSLPITHIDSCGMTL
jgi:hypothetical protein